MFLDFKFGCPEASIQTKKNALQIGLCNPAIGDSVERWELGNLSYEKQGNIHCLKSDRRLIGGIILPVTPETLAEKTNQIYQEIFELSQAYNLFRFWNFVPNINHRPKDGLENYQAFCKGRALAFLQNECSEAAKQIPAASGVGTTGEHLTVVFTSGLDDPKHVENPQQTPAYHYPERYGPKPPSFARATTVKNEEQLSVYISGTSSIIQSESIGQTVEEQLAVTLENLKLIEQSAVGSAVQNLNEPRIIRVYLRDASCHSYVSETLKRSFIRPNDSITYVIADICREELMVEIEVTLGV